MEPQPEQPASPNMSLANISASNGINQHSQDVLKKFHWAIKQVANEHGTSNDTALTEEELIQLIRTWEPQRDIVCLYVRWSRQLRRNFNLDSIATLLCLSRQCGYTPLNFLRKVKTCPFSRTKRVCMGWHSLLMCHSAKAPTTTRDLIKSLLVSLSLLRSYKSK